tara:strand:- start:106 stop:957 length:852 start_codon:yes stop_codon:yes gene_type:complete
MRSKKKKQKKQLVQRGYRKFPPFISVLGKNVESKPEEDTVLTEVKYTSDYDKFSIIEQNRDIADSSVNNLVVSIKKKGQLQPIIVNSLKQIIDGQHRYEACKILGIPVAYLESKNATIKDVVLINNTQRAWKMNDYLKTFIHKNHTNNAEYIKVKDFIEEFNFSFRITLFLLSGKSDCNQQEFRNGDYKIENLERAERWGNQLLKIKAFAPQLVKIGKFCLAFVKIQKLEGFSLLLAYEQIEKNIRKFDRCINQEEWDEAMVRAYNYNLKRNKKRISIKKDGF